VVNEQQEDSRTTLSKCQPFGAWQVHKNTLSPLRPLSQQFLYRMALMSKTFCGFRPKVKLAYYGSHGSAKTTLIILTPFLRDSGQSDEEIKKLLGFDEQVLFEMDL
jgi:hypothetical protein